MALWCASILWLFKKIIGCDYRIEGFDNLPKEGGYVIASKHQSAWETIAPFTFLSKATFVYKKELGSIPFYGWYNKAVHNIKVDRKAGGAALKKVVLQATERVQEGYKVIIFPQGTRVRFDQPEVEYKPAIYAMYKAGLPIYPAALNSGNFWPKDGAKKSGTIVMKFMPRISPGLSREDFMARLKACIEIESNALNDSGHKHSPFCGCHNQSDE